MSWADKVHNARSILRDYREHGEALWSRFNANGDEQLQYYARLLAVFGERDPTPIVGELERVLSELQAERARRLRESAG